MAEEKILHFRLLSLKFMKNHLDERKTHRFHLIYPCSAKMVICYCCNNKKSVSCVMAVFASCLSLCPALGMPAYKCFTASWAKVKLHSSVTHCELTSNSHFNSPTISLELIHKSQFWHLKRLSVPYSHTHFTFHA